MSNVTSIYSLPEKILKLAIKNAETDVLVDVVHGYASSAPSINLIDKESISSLYLDKSWYGFEYLFRNLPDGNFNRFGHYVLFYGAGKPLKYKHFMDITYLTALESLYILRSFRRQLLEFNNLGCPPELLEDIKQHYFQTYPEHNIKHTGSKYLEIPTFEGLQYLLNWFKEYFLNYCDKHYYNLNLFPPEYSLDPIERYELIYLIDYYSKYINFVHKELVNIDGTNVTSTHRAMLRITS